MLIEGLEKLKTYRKHNCERAHRSFRTLATCMFPRAHWVVGEGAYATLAWCGGLSVMLHSDLEKATISKDQIDMTGCGHLCTKRHEVVRLELSSTGS
jgi:hypothetical protein